MMDEVEFRALKHYRRRTRFLGKRLDNMLTALSEIDNTRARIAIQRDCELIMDEVEATTEMAIDNKPIWEIPDVDDSESSTAL